MSAGAKGDAFVLKRKRFTVEASYITVPRNAAELEVRGIFSRKDGGTTWCLALLFPKLVTLSYMYKIREHGTCLVSCLRTCMHPQALPRLLIGASPIDKLQSWAYGRRTRLGSLERGARR